MKEFNEYEQTLEYRNLQRLAEVEEERREAQKLANILKFKEEYMTEVIRENAMADTSSTETSSCDTSSASEPNIEIGSDNSDTEDEDGTSEEKRLAQEAETARLEEEQRQRNEEQLAAIRDRILNEQAEEEREAEEEERRKAEEEERRKAEEEERRRKEEQTPPNDYER